MILQNKKRRALWTVAFAAAPIGIAHATTLNAPLGQCNASSQLTSIGWADQSVVSDQGAGIAATELGTSPIYTKGSPSPRVPFQCSYNLIVNKLGTGGSNVFATAALTQGDAFEIDFGTIYNPQLFTKLGSVTLHFVPQYTGYTVSSGFSTLKTLQVTTDFNLYWDAVDPLTNQLLYQDYLGVQVISGASALSSGAMTSDFFLNSSNQFVFEAPIAGSTQVNLLDAPPPAPSTSVSEPASLALMAAGLAGLAALVRKRKKTDSGGEPEA